MTAVNIDSFSITIDSLTVRIDSLDDGGGSAVVARAFAGGGVGGDERVPYWRRTPWTEEPWPDELVEDPIEADKKRKAAAERKRRLEARVAEIRETRERDALRATSRNPQKRYGDRFSAAMSLLERQGWKKQ